MNITDYHILIWLGIGFFFLFANLLFHTRSRLISSPATFVRSATDSILYSIGVQVVFYFLLAVHLRRFLHPKVEVLWGFWQQTFLIFILGIVLFASHWLLRGIVSWLLRDGDFWVNNFKQNVFLKSFAAFVFWILLLVFEFAHGFHQNPVIQGYILLGVLALYILINFWKDHFDRDFMASYSLYHKFLYLCALEILPLAVILKAVLEVG